MKYHQLIAYKAFAVLLAVGLWATAVEAQPGPPAEPVPSRQASQTRFRVHLDGVSAVQLAWWFQHVGDPGNRYWTPLAPDLNQKAEWAVNPREDAHQIIGAALITEQRLDTALFPNGKLRMNAKFADYSTRNRFFVEGQQQGLMPVIPLPADYKPAYPSPLSPAQSLFSPPVSPADNGFNQHLILIDEDGFATGRMLWSWRNTGSDDTSASFGQPPAIDVEVTYYQPWLEGGNRPRTLRADGYYHSEAQVAAIGAAWQRVLQAMPAHLPRWFGTDTQDTEARGKGWTVSAVVDTGVAEGTDSKMWYWWWNHAMGDAPGASYVLWCPHAHHSVRWVDGFSPKDLLGSDRIPLDRNIPGVIYPDLQGSSLTMNGGGMMAYPVSMSPISGRYKHLNPMFIVSSAQIANFGTERFPPPPAWLLHQWEDTRGGAVHRSTILMKLPLIGPVTQRGFYDEHQSQEGLYWGSASMRRAYASWLEKQSRR